MQYALFGAHSRVERQYALFGALRPHYYILSLLRPRYYILSYCGRATIYFPYCGRATVYFPWLSPLGALRPHYGGALLCYLVITPLPGYHP